MVRVNLDILTVDTVIFLSGFNHRSLSVQGQLCEAEGSEPSAPKVLLVKPTLMQMLGCSGFLLIIFYS